MALESKLSEVAENEFYSSAYARFLLEKKLKGSKCKKCGNLCVPPKPICPKCRGGEMELVDIKGKGKLAAYAVVSVGAPMMAEEGFDRNNPYCSGVVELEEGPKVSARLLGFDLASPDKIKIGTPVSLEFVERGEGEEKKSFLAFKKV